MRTEPFTETPLRKQNPKKICQKLRASLGCSVKKRRHFGLKN